MNVLFWNVQKKRLDGLAVDLVCEHDVDLLILIEHAGGHDSLLPLLRHNGDYERLNSQIRFAVYGRFPRSCAEQLDTPVHNQRADFWHLTLENSVDINLAVVHGPDIRNNPSSDRRLFFERLSENLLWVEARAGHKRSIILGDFNANPFDAEIAGASGLHAVRMKHVKGKSCRRVQGRDYEFFYNPMWACYGRAAPAPPASYYYYGYQEHELFWHMIDQCVLRPDLLDRFPEEDLRIVTSAGPRNLLTEQGIPNAKDASDHLPVLFRLNLES